MARARARAVHKDEHSLKQSYQVCTVSELSHCEYQGCYVKSMTGLV